MSSKGRGRKPSKPVRRNPARGPLAGRLREPGFRDGRDQIVKSLEILSDAAEVSSAYEAELTGSVLLGLLIQAGTPQDAMVSVVLDIIDELERRAEDYSYPAVRMLAAIGPEEAVEYATRAAERLAVRIESGSVPQWADHLGAVTPGACYLAPSPIGEAHIVCCEFTYADGSDPHAVWAAIDPAWHGAAGSLVVTEDPAKALALVAKAARRIGAEVRQIPAAEAALLLLPGIDALIKHGPPPEEGRRDEQFATACSGASMARSRAMSLLGPDAKPPARDEIRALWPPEARARLVEEFLTSPQARDLTDIVSRTMPNVLIHVIIDGLGRDPVLLTPRGIQRALLYLFPSSVAAPDRFGDRVPGVMRAWADWTAERRGLGKSDRRRLQGALESAIRKFPAHWNGPLASQERRYVRDLPDEVACSGDLLRPVLERRVFAIPRPADRADGTVQVKGKRQARHVSELDAADPVDRGLITVNDLNARGIPQHAFASYVAVVEQLWTGEPPRTWEAAQRMLAAGKPRTAVLDRLARDHSRTTQG